MSTKKWIFLFLEKGFNVEKEKIKPTSEKLKATLSPFRSKCLEEK